MLFISMLFLSLFDLQSASFVSETKRKRRILVAVGSFTVLFFSSYEEEQKETMPLLIAIKQYRTPIFEKKKLIRLIKIQFKTIINY